MLQVAVLCNDLATALDRVGRFSEAESLVNDSLEIVSAVGSGPEAAEYLATFYYNLGAILTHRGISFMSGNNCTFTPTVRIWGVRTSWLDLGMHNHH